MTEEAVGMDCRVESKALLLVATIIYRHDIVLQSFRQSVDERSTMSIKHI